MGSFSGLGLGDEGPFKESNGLVVAQTLTRIAISEPNRSRLFDPFGQNAEGFSRALTLDSGGRRARSLSQRSTLNSPNERIALMSAETLSCASISHEAQRTCYVPGLRCKRSLGLATSTIRFTKYHSNTFNLCAHVSGRLPTSGRSEPCRCSGR